MLTTEGRPYDGTEIRILGPDGAPLPAGEVGDVVVNGPSRFLCFLGNDELTRDSLTAWGGYRTGDLGYLDEDGHLVYVGPQQGHHPARRRDGRAGRARARADAPPRGPRGRGRPAARRAPRRARVRRAHPQARATPAPTLAELQEFLEPRASPSTCGPSRSRSSTSSRARRR